MLIDSHCHLDMIIAQSAANEGVGQLTITDILTNAKENGVEHMLCIAVNTENWQAMKDICAPHHDIISISAGVHPCDIEQYNKEILLQQVVDSQVIAIGETGLDYHYCQDDSVKKLQQQIFAEQIDIAKQLKKPLIIHTREAKQQTIALMQSENAEIASGVMHCFTEDVAMAKQALDLGFYISFSGIITFKNANQIREVADYVPLDRILIETDAPYLAPSPHRGKLNQPSYVKFVAEQIANIRNLTTQEIAKITSDNFNRLFLEK